MNNRKSRFYLHSLCVGSIASTLLFAPLEARSQESPPPAAPLSTSSASVSHDSASFQPGKSAVTAQPHSSAQKIEPTDYMPTHTVTKLTYYFPPITEQERAQAASMQMRNYIIYPDPDDCENISLFRHYDYSVNSQTQQLGFPFQVPVITGEGTYRNDQKRHCLLASSARLGGARGLTIQVPPADTAGTIYQEGDACFQLQDKLFTVKGPAGEFKDCVSVINYGGSIPGMGNEKVRIFFYAPGIGEVLSMCWDEKTSEFIPYAILTFVGCDTSVERSAQINGKVINSFMAAGNLTHKLFSQADPKLPDQPNAESKKLQNRHFFRKYNLATGRFLDQLKINWERFDIGVNPKDAKDIIELGTSIQGIDYIDAVSLAMLRYYNVDESNNVALLVPPFSSLGKPYLYHDVYYKLESKSFQVKTPGQVFENCLAVTRYSAVPDQFDQDSCRVFYAQGIGEVARSTYNLKTQAFEHESSLIAVTKEITPDPQKTVQEE